MKIEPLEKKSLSDEVVAKIKSMIVSGDLKEGDRISSERELCEQFCVSRASVREGLKILSLQGLISRTNAGTVITTNFASILEETLALKILLNDYSYEDVMEARMFLERTMVRLAASRIETQNISIMSLQLESMIKAEREGNSDDFVLADIAFHQQIAKASKSEVLASLYNAIITLVFRAQKSVKEDNPVMKESIKFHGKILEALKNKNAEQAEKEMQMHLMDVQKRLNHLIKKETIIGGL
ncbi:MULTISPECIES: FadR/GntR family transcriptional regulator [unclassified Marinobacter]|jgi:GntR family transcriptional repressor for pyruvate dehydrogenase complex|uniref:FadR/GntR family transcriptional regulator n=1 Tax=unclassified Marinobacter TaxID=83889 RepID=UPI00200D25F1|nr:MULTISPECIES: FadR/GntR family transcriptional regulator [unclassified Marinobacter]UQG55154.1 FadR family transcriptional regulator [Marinobacter sp. M4C]UQG63956.1 FadR family transcriptional regulator [Marinobacter sp. M2C]UQG68239.1 FadR family transcriptional regulator [Marinobacter sp. M1C]